MKKIIILALSLMLLFSACSAKGEKTNTEEKTIAVTGIDGSLEGYVGEGTLATLRTLVNMHAKFETEYFLKSHPTIDDKNTVTQNGVVYAPVTGGDFKTYKELSNAVYETYSKDSADNLLKLHYMYTDIDGKLHFEVEHEVSYRGDKYAYDWSDFTITPTEVSDEKIVFTIHLKYSSGDDAAIAMTAVTENGNWRIIA